MSADRHGGRRHIHELASEQRFLAPHIDQAFDDGKTAMTNDKIHEKIGRKK